MAVEQGGWRQSVRGGENGNPGRGDGAGGRQASDAGSQHEGKSNGGCAGGTLAGRRRPLMDQTTLHVMLDQTQLAIQPLGAELRQKTIQLIVHRLHPKQCPNPYTQSARKPLRAERSPLVGSAMLNEGSRHAMRIPSHGARGADRMTRGVVG